jgi:hypothetical protein
MCELPTSGGLDNLHAMSANEADIGFAQVDTWADMQMSNENIAGLQAVLSLNFNYLHVVVAANGFAVAGESRFGGLLRGKPQYVLMERFSSLRGQRVAVVGSTALLGRKLEQRLRYGLHFVDVETDDQAFQQGLRTRTSYGFEPKHPDAFFVRPCGSLALHAQAHLAVFSHRDRSHQIQHHLFQ